MSARIICRPTVNLPGARLGALVLVDPDDPNMKVLLDRGLLLPDLTANAAIAPSARARFAVPLEDAAPDAQEAPDAPATSAAGDPAS